MRITHLWVYFKNLIDTNEKFQEKATFCIFVKPHEYKCQKGIRFNDNWVNGKKRSLNILTILMALILSSVIDECYIWHALIIHDLMNAEQRKQPNCFILFRRDLTAHFQIRFNSKKLLAEFMVLQMNGSSSISASSTKKIIDKKENYQEKFGILCMQYLL
ncbi:hypothetical protein RhiirA4_413529 [Rhizophagus irregularis]|uniref:Uncharacterized protein n=1 Tax=Rhizophagus irregularis TaxID=588596 RepID=A0A2I1FTE7_9GLOM|nr:hypothetical protein RhiirA4_413529 [Rhizophagus irregularis]